MTDTAAPPPAEPPHDDDIAAAEHVLGATSAGERFEAEARRRYDKTFDASVIAWEERLQPLVDQIPPVEPSPKVWPRIERQVKPRVGLFDHAGLWRVATAACLAVAAVSLFILYSPAKPPPAPAPAAAPQPVLTALVQPEPGKAGPVITASLDRSRNELIFTAASVSLDADKSAELWVIPQGQKPQSLGVITAGQERRMPMPPALGEAGRAGAVLAVTAEQAGGSPDGAPHGPVVATGGFKSA